jgi:ParB family chromosome partitioning protein
MAKMGMLKNVSGRTGTQDSHSINIMVKDILIGDIIILENVRKEYTGINELAESIRQHGLLQPITVYANNDQYVVKTGHRRFIACKSLYQSEPERFHSIRCIVSDSQNIAVIQLVENIQRENISQFDLCNALNALREQGMSHREIALAMGKTEGYIKNLFMGVNEVNKDTELKELISHAGVTLQDVTESRGIPDKKERLDLLKQRSNGKVNRAELRKKAKASKADCSTSQEASITSASLVSHAFPSFLPTASTIAKERLDQYISDKADNDDLALWEFYSWLLEQAKTHQVDRSGFISREYLSDKKQASNSLST